VSRARRRRAPLAETATAADAPAVTDADLVALIGRQDVGILETLQRARDRDRSTFGAPSPDSDLYSPEEGRS
jgi:hypothetical protein